MEGLRGRIGANRLGSDPVVFAHAAERQSTELVAFLASSLAFGNVKAIMASIAELLERLGPRPFDAVIGRPGDIKRVLRGFRHRWAGEEDVAALLIALGRLIRDLGSIEVAFRNADVPSEPNYLVAMAQFADRLATEAGVAARRRGFRFLVSHPSRGGAMKRMNLFLRWMVRPADGVDLGWWTGFDPARLIVPLDVHVAFHGRVLGMSRRRTADLTMALEVTEALKALDPTDPLRYDFALCHLGIHGECQKRRVPSICSVCPIEAWCRLPKRP